MAYHHGDLRRAVLDAALEVIAADGPSAISLRDLARRAGVSHAAPAHHFKDKAGLLTAIAIEGNELLAESLAEAIAEDRTRLIDLGVRYVRFAMRHPGHFAVMYRPDLYHRHAPELITARERTGKLLRGTVQLLTGDQSARLTQLAAWSAAHGFATLALAGNLDKTIGEQDPAELFRALAGVMFVDHGTIES
ncbi:TetR/AcrR family transcriptional regulator [Kibdelosporangium phytohabitans]|uniref:TetR family transcriptional regulator n=1 Tax=Kibdelosporangium phytohabitans TaxID=860235 RepID=A0A0N9I8W6_9PSEU|nr:TetR/AcrR family transcriptional regulator [Kibdelosporangium phytohabitans]ALG12388.1 TetR family transcriptional regulator [Kibdelosporangium phytohabitans]MBE1463965.1 AcrR family transcriptional regulator [Kibdelosporangium phytohabitans]